MNPESQRLDINQHKRIPLEPWGPYLSERQWGTVREDYSTHGDAWGYFPFEQSHCRAYLWGEDGIAGISDFFQNLCFSVALWNGKDKVLKERLYGLGNYQGNHGEDVKELYYYMDNLPSHYYMEYLYKYPQQAFPYEKLIAENKKRSRQEPEYEIIDTGIFNEDRYFDVETTYAKYDSTDIAIRIRITNRGPEKAKLTVLPTLWFYNRWQYTPEAKKPSIHIRNRTSVRTQHKRLGAYYLHFREPDDLLMTDNETNRKLVAGTDDGNVFTKDAFNRVLIDGENPKPFQRKKTGHKIFSRLQTHPGGGRIRNHPAQAQPYPPGTAL